MEKNNGQNPLSSLIGALFAAELMKATAEKKATTTDATAASAPVKSPVSEAEALREKALKIDADAATDVLKLTNDQYDEGCGVFICDCPTGNWDEYDRKYRDQPHTYVQVTEMFSDGVKKAVSVVAEGDVYLKNVGRAIALRRALNKLIPKDYFTAGSLMKQANALEKAPKPEAKPVPTIKPGDTIRILNDGANGAGVKKGDTFKVARVLNDGMDIQVDFPPYIFTPDNFTVVSSPTPPAPMKLPDEYAGLEIGDTVVAPNGERMKVKEFAPCPRCGFPGFYGEGDTRFIHLYTGLKIEKAKPEALTFKPGDKVKYEYDSKTLTVTEVTTCMCGKPALRVKERTGTIHAEKCRLVESAPEAVTPTIKVGDTVRVVKKDLHPSTSSNAKIGSVYTVDEVSDRNPTRIRLNIISCPWVNVADVELVTVEKAPEAITRYIHRPAVAGERIRILKDNAQGADVKAGDILTVKEHKTCSCGAPAVRTEATADSPEWNIHDDSYDVVETVSLWEKRPAKPGETIRILVDFAEGAAVKKGDTFKVKRIVPQGSTPDTIETEERHWLFAPDSYEVKNV